ncbi:MAG: polyketide cyclase, partial [Actinomycetota bacterium]|nr:polyketide cyclase [Actinomycetota bacterium]
MTSLTESNRSVIEAFAEVFYGERDPRRAFETFVAPDYIQHNPRFPDGRDAAIDGLAGMFTAQGARFDV